MIVRKCTFDEVKNNSNFAALAKEYSDECAINELPCPGEKLSSYDVLANSGVFHCFGAFFDECLVGFVAVLTPVIPHYGVAVAVTESLFVASEHRPSGAGLMLLRAAEECAAKQGCPGILVSAPTGGRLATILPRRGFRETNRVFFKEISRD